MDLDYIGYAFCVVNVSVVKWQGEAGAFRRM